jgi:hypothetical protein
MRGIKKQASLILALALAVAALVPSVGSAYTRAESGAGVQDNGQPSGITERTPTELAQRQSAPVSATSTPASSPASESGGFDWGDAAIGASVVLALGLSGAAIVAVTRRQRRSTPSLGAVRS